MKKMYLNLTNGLEWLEMYPEAKLVRIQSSVCESTNLDRVLAELDYNFLFDLALGHEITVIDGSQNNQESRAMFQGIQWILYVLNRRWLDKSYKPMVKKCNCEKYFAEKYKQISRITKNRLNYVKRFLSTNSINLRGVTFPTVNDGKYNFYRTRLILN